ncbi:MAG: hypothetical protein JO307_25340 [Bryobacterales bacterium]|nr:hypothetical protein [Bryobacterales bacterium]
MKREFDELRWRAERVRWWAASTPDPRDRERLEQVAHDYDEMADSAERDAATPVSR